MHQYSYDGTLEGYLSIIYHCIELQVAPKRMKSTRLIREFEANDYEFIRTNYYDADRLYRHIGDISSVQVQQMILDSFLTNIPNKEMDIYYLICKAYREGAKVAGDYNDEVLHKLHIAIRDLYREAHFYILQMPIVHFEDVSLAMIEPRNFVLPIIFSNISDRPELDDFLIFDRRHNIGMIRHGEQSGIYDLSRLPCQVVTDSFENVYNTIWKYVRHGNLGISAASGAQMPRNNSLERKKQGDLAGALTRFWLIAS